MAGRPLTSAAGTFGTIVGTAQMSLLDTLTSSIFSSGFNDSALGWVNYGTDIGTQNNYAVTLPQAPSAYVAGMCLAVQIANSNNGASVINVNSVGNVPIVNKANIALAGGELITNKVAVMVYDGTSFRIVSFCGKSSALGSISTTTASVECAGYDSVSVSVIFTGAGLTLSLAHLGFGVPVVISAGNLNGVTQSFAAQPTNPSGTAYSNSFIVPAGGIGTQINMMSTGFSISNSATRIMSGVSILKASGTILFS